MLLTESALCIFYQPHVVPQSYYASHAFSEKYKQKKTRKNAKYVIIWLAFTLTDPEHDILITI